MLRFGIRNLRRLKQIDPIEIRRITLLVGRNSSGKSSFLRALPLLRQSIMTRTSSPILWFGDLVDFGSFKNSVSDNDTKQPIIFTFGFDVISRADNFWYRRPDEDRDRIHENVTFSVRIVQRDRVIIQSLDVSLGDTNERYTIEVGANGTVTSLTRNGDELLPPNQEYSLLITPGSIFPDIYGAARNKDKSIGPFFHAPGPTGPLVQVAASVLRNLPSATKGATSSDGAAESQLQEAAYLLLTMPTFDKGSIPLRAGSSWRFFQPLFDELVKSERGVVFNKFKDIWTVWTILDLIAGISRRLRTTISETLYIGPARARSERYYRLQDLAVSEIDPDGKNFAMFLNSLTNQQVERMSDWVERLFGYRVDKATTEGHISINLKEGDSETNIVDTGYGVSQILPVLGQIWWSANRPLDRSRSNSEVAILAIEQPELHLHPAHQAYLADALAEPPPGPAYSSERPPTHYIVETHSEALVNRLGKLVAEGKLKPDDVQVIIFEPDSGDPRRTNTRVSKFGKQGQLIGWPYGFFQPER
jgi:predicted ATPase